MKDRSVPEATVGRLPVYLRALIEMAERGATTTSSEGLAEAAGVNSAKVRKDLSYLGSYGTRGVGYDVAYLIHQIRRELGLTQHWPVLIVGAGNLGHALVNYRGFVERGFRIVGLLDSAVAKVGERVVGGANLVSATRDAFHSGALHVAFFIGAPAVLLVTGIVGWLRGPRTLFLAEEPNGG